MQNPSSLEQAPRAKCAVCQQPLYYQNDRRFVPEIQIDLSLPKFQEPVVIEGLDITFGMATLCVHVSCWNSSLGKLLKNSTL